MDYKPARIRDVGLRNYLNITKREHNDYGYADFAKLVTSGLNHNNLARAFDVSRHTIVKWLAIYQEEHEATTAK